MHNFCPILLHTSGLMVSFAKIVNLKLGIKTLIHTPAKYLIYSPPPDTLSASVAVPKIPAKAQTFLPSG